MFEPKPAWITSPEKIDVDQVAAQVNMDNTGYFVVKRWVKPSLWQRLWGAKDHWQLCVERGPRYVFINWSAVIKTYGFHTTLADATQSLFNGIPSNRKIE